MLLALCGGASNGFSARPLPPPPLPMLFWLPMMGAQPPPPPDPTAPEAVGLGLGLGEDPKTGIPSVSLGSAAAVAAADDSSTPRRAKFSRVTGCPLSPDGAAAPCSEGEDGVKGPW